MGVYSLWVPSWIGRYTGPGTQSSLSESIVASKLKPSEFGESPCRLTLKLKSQKPLDQFQAKPVGERTHVG